MELLQSQDCIGKVRAPSVNRYAITEDMTGKTRVSLGAASLRHE